MQYLLNIKDNDASFCAISYLSVYSKVSRNNSLQVSAVYLLEKSATTV